jgi:hypothetical protein
MLGDLIRCFPGLSKRVTPRCLVPLFIAVVLSINAYSAAFVAHVDADLDRDGRPEIVDIDSGRAMALQVRRGQDVLWQGVPAAWKPWKLELADVDSDGKLEIVVGVFKSTKFFPKPHNCLFIYGWSGDQGFPRWLGSSLGRPFTDFVFTNTGGNASAELVALETTLEGRKSVAFYRWNSFGFTLERQQGDWQAAEDLAEHNGVISLDADGKKILISGEKKRSN